MKLIVILLCFLLASCSHCNDKPLFSFNESPKGKTLIHSTTYTPSGSTWGAGLDEKKVFHHQLSWGDKKNGWQIRIGKGGQIYSFRGPFGEAMPPQVHHGSEWNDEVWQLVSVCSQKNDRTLVKVGKHRKRPLAYFIHGSGIYKRDPLLKETFYNPILAEHSTPSSYAILNWGQHAHVPTVHKSNALYYTQFNVHSDGTIELNYTIHNFGKDVLNYFNTPWGGVRESALPVHILSKPDGNYAPTEFVSFSHKGITDMNKTGGWSGFFTENTPDAWGIAIVFGKSNELNKRAKVRYRWGYAGARKNPRDYFVSVVNPRLPVSEDDTFRVKIFIIVDQLKNIKKRATALMDKVNYNVEQLTKVPEIKHALSTANFNGELKLSAWPTKDTKPLFLIKRTEDGKEYITDDLYKFSGEDDFKKYYPGYKGNDPVLRPYDGKTKYLKFLGYINTEFKVK